MARSNVIWLVTDKSRLPLGAFTVKHELVTWLGKQLPSDVGGCTVWKIPDGFHTTAGRPYPLAAQDVTEDITKIVVKASGDTYVGTFAIGGAT